VAATGAAWFPWGGNSPDTERHYSIIKWHGRAEVSISGVQDPVLESNQAGYKDFFGFGLDCISFPI